MRLIKWVARRATQALVWVAVKTCRAIIFVVDVVKETAKAAAEIIVGIVKRVRNNPIFQNIRKGLNIVKKLKDAKELPGMIERAGKVVWAFATGKACFSWAASSGWCTLCSLGYAALLLGGFTFSLYLLGLLSTVFRS